MTGYNKDEVYDGWNFEIGEEGDGGPATVLPAGDYPFKVVSVDRSYHSGSQNVPPCNMVTLTMEVDGGELGTGRLYENLYFVKKLAWKIKQIFVATGLIPSDAGRFTPDWSAIMGANGWVTVKQEEYNGRLRNSSTAYLKPERACEIMFERAQAKAEQPKPQPVQGSFNFPAAQ